MDKMMDMNAVGASAPAAAPTVAPPSSILDDKKTSQEIDADTAKAAVFWEVQGTKNADLALQNTAYLQAQRSQSLWTYGIFAVVVVAVMLIMQKRGTNPHSLGCVPPTNAKPEITLIRI